jgi:hypothetical protein
MFKRLRRIYRILRSLPYSLYHFCTFARPNLKFRHSLTSKYQSHPTFHLHIKQLEEDGVLVLPSYYSGETLKQMQTDFERAVPQEPVDSPIDIEWYTVQGDCMENSIPISRMAVDPYLTDLAAYYWGKPISLTQSIGTRLEPCQPYEGAACQWHHDSLRKHIKVTIFLTDVPENGQVMQYIPKTHKTIYWDLGNYQESRFTREQIDPYFKKYSKPLSCVCPAGTVVIFDPNGLHRANRSLTARRDSWTFQFNSGERKTFKPISSLHPEVLSGLNQDQKRMMRVHE